MSPSSAGARGRITVRDRVKWEAGNLGVSNKQVYQTCKHLAPRSCSEGAPSKDPDTKARAGKGEKGSCRCRGF